MNVSVVIATCGKEEWADLAWSRAYPSVRRQEPQPVEIVVEHYPGLTVSAARNTAARNASGDHLCFLDADDELAPGYLAAMARAEAAEQEWALLVPDVQYVHPEFAEEPRCLDTGQPLYAINWAVIGTVIPSHLFFTAEGFPDEPIYEDWALMLALHYDLELPLVAVHDAVYRANVNPAGRNLGAAAAEVYARYRERYERVAQ